MLAAVEELDLYTPIEPMDLSIDNSQVFLTTSLSGSAAVQIDCVTC